MLLGLAAAFLPSHAGAFWPFSSNADAATPATLPSSSTPALEAVLNTNPNASAPIALATSDGSALVPYSGPAGSLGNVVGFRDGTDRISVYVVRPGDTLSEIADMFGVSVNTILWANNLSSARNVHPGDTLVILPVSGVEHKIAKGDTLKSLAKKYGADAEEIANFNGLDASAPLTVGSEIIIPGGEIALPAPAKRSVATGRTIREPYLGGDGPDQGGYFRNPIPGAIVTQTLHGWNGVDLGAARGTPISAAADGVVIIARLSGWNGGYGNYVVIQHDNGTQTLYSHASKVLVRPGQSVTAGQTIALVGNSGLSTGAHLHFEVRGAANPLRNCPAGIICAVR